MMNARDIYLLMEDLSKSISTLSTTFRDGMGGMKEWVKDRFFFVRDVYQNVCLPSLDGAELRAGSFTSSTSTPTSVRFERPVDSILFHSTTDIYVDFTPAMNNPMTFSAGVTHNINVRAQTLYIKAAATAGTVRIWGLF